MNLRAKVTALFLSLSVVPLIAVSLLTYQDARAELEASTLARLNTINALKLAEYDRWIEDNEHALLSLAQRPRLTELTATLTASSATSPEFAAATEALLDAHLNPVRRTDVSWGRFYILHPSSGVVLVTTDDRLLGADLSDTEAFTAGQTRTSTQQVTYIPELDSLVVLISTPILSADGALIGVLLGDLDRNELHEIVAQSSNSTETEETYFVNADSILATDTQLDSSALLGSAVSSPGIARCLAQGKGWGTYDDYRGLPVVGVYLWSPEHDLCAVTEIDQSEALGPINELRRTTVLIGAALAIITGVIALGFAQTLTAPLAALEEGASQLAAGNLQHRVNIHQRDELGVVARAFDQMAAALGTAQRELSDTNAALEQRVAARTEELAHSEARFRTLFEAVPVALSVSRIEDGQILAANEAFEKLTAHVKDSGILGKTTVELYKRAEDRARLLKILKNQGYISQEEVEIRAADGSSRWISTSIRPVTLNGETALLAGTQDITTQKEMQLALEESRRTLSTLMSNLPGMAYRCTNEPGWPVVLASAGTLALTGYGPEDFTSGAITFADIIHAADLDRVWETVSEAVEKNVPFEVKYRIRTADGMEKVVWEQGQTVGTKPDGTAILEGFITDVSAAHRAEEAEREQRRFNEALLDTSEALSRSLDLQEVFGRVLHSLEDVAPHTGANILMFNEDYTAARITAICRCYDTNEHTPPPVGGTLNTSEWALMEAIQTGQPIVIENTHEDAAYTRDPIFDWVASYAGAPISVDGRVIGILNLDSDTPGTFADLRLEQLEAFAHQAGLAIRNAQLYEAVERRAATLEALRQVTLNITEELEVPAVLEDLLASAIKLAGGTGGSVYIYSALSNRLELATRGLSVSVPIPETIERGVGLMGRVWATGKTFRLENYDAWEHRIQLSAPAPYPIISVPIHWGEDFLGVMNVVHETESQHRFSDEDAALLELLADQAAVAIHNAQMYQELERYSGFLELAVHEATIELRRAKERVEAILNHSPDVILLLEPTGQIVETNAALSTQFGYHSRDVQGEKPTRLVSEADRDELGQLLEKTATSTELKPLRAIMTALRADGSTFDADLMLAPVYEDGAANGIVCSLRDITALKQVERMKDEFISTAAHELRTPLTSVRGFSEILLTRDLDDERQRRYLQMINDQSEQLSEIVEDLLDISRLEAGEGLTIQTSPVRIGEILQHEINLFAEVAPEYVFELESPSVDALVYADAFRIGQVVRNILSNAVKYSRAGSRIEIGTSREHDRLHVAIRDHGMGMTANQALQAFNKFYRAETVSRSKPGTGLGLTICKLIVEAHDGAIWLESAPGKGTTAHFTLPLAENGKG